MIRPDGKGHWGFREIFEEQLQRNGHRILL